MSTPERAAAHVNQFAARLAGLEQSARLMPDTDPGADFLGVGKLFLAADKTPYEILARGLPNSRLQFNFITAHPRVLDASKRLGSISLWATPDVVGVSVAKENDSSLELRDLAKPIGAWVAEAADQAETISERAHGVVTPPDYYPTPATAPSLSTFFRSSNGLYAVFFRSPRPGEIPSDVKDATYVTRDSRIIVDIE